MGNQTKKGLCIAAAALAYGVLLWGLLLLLFFLSQEVPAWPRVNVLTWETLLPLALGSLQPVVCAEKWFSGRLGLHWLFVRLVTPFIGFFLFLITLIGAFPVLMQNMFLLFPVIFFVLIQGGVLLLSVCVTALCGRIRKSWEPDEEPDFATDPKLRPIKLPPKSEQTAPRPAPTAPRHRKRNWKSAVMVAAIVAVTIGSMVAAFLWFPSYQIALMFWPAVTQADAVSQPRDWRGRRAGEDIPRLTGVSQLEDGTYDNLTYLTVDTERLISLSYYRLKDTSDSRFSGSGGYGRSRYGRRLPSVYTHFAGVDAMYYGQYCVVELEDGSCIGAYLDSAYTTALGKVRLPVGQAVYVSGAEAELLTEAAETYPIPTDRLLMMHSDSFYKEIKLLDHSIRLVSIGFVPAAEFCLAILWVLIKKRRN